MTDPVEYVWSSRFHDRCLSAMTAVGHCVRMELDGVHHGKNPLPANLDFEGVGNMTLDGQPLNGLTMQGDYAGILAFTRFNGAARLALEWCLDAGREEVFCVYTFNFRAWNLRLMPDLRPESAY